ncbi:MAG: hypothetical protein KJ072_14635 [Verrucomicrobia bacterium]|nr:hypothetical protein [Verrucomicrobiota bacterium]
MKPQSYVIVVALFLVAIFLLWPGKQSDSLPPAPAPQGPASTLESPAPVPRSPELSPLREGSEGSPRGARVPAMVEIEMNPETPPEQSLQWQITRQQALLQALQRHLDASETRWRNATNEADRQVFHDQIQVLKQELSLQTEALTRLQRSIEPAGSSLDTPKVPGTTPE